MSTSLPGSIPPTLDELEAKLSVRASAEMLELAYDGDKELVADALHAIRILRDERTLCLAERDHWKNVADEQSGVATHYLQKRDAALAHKERVERALAELLQRPVKRKGIAIAVWVSENFVENYVARSLDGRFRITMELGEPDDQGVHCPVFTRHDDPLPVFAERDAAIAERDGLKEQMVEAGALVEELESVHNYAMAGKLALQKDVQELGQLLNKARLDRDEAEEQEFKCRAERDAALANKQIAQTEHDRLMCAKEADRIEMRAVLARSEVERGEAASLLAEMIQAEADASHPRYTTILEWMTAHAGLNSRVRAFLSRLSPAPGDGK